MRVIISFHITLGSIILSSSPMHCPSPVDRHINTNILRHLLCTPWRLWSAAAAAFWSTGAECAQRGFSLAPHTVSFVEVELLQIHLQQTSHVNHSTKALHKVSTTPLTGETCTSQKLSMDMGEANVRKWQHGSHENALQPHFWAQILAQRISSDERPNESTRKARITPKKWIRKMAIYFCHLIYFCRNTAKRILRAHSSEPNIYLRRSSLNTREATHQNYF